MGNIWVIVVIYDPQEVDYPTLISVISHSYGHNMFNEMLVRGFSYMCDTISFNIFSNERII